MADASGMMPPEAAVASPVVKKPFKFWTITDIVGLDRQGWKFVQDSAMWVAGAASLLNLVLVVVFASAIASQSAFGLLDDAPEAWRLVVWFVLMLTATGVAAVLQLCTDFGLAWASGLAGEKYKLSPSVIMIVWVMCLCTTLFMKFDLYSSWAHERGAVLALAQTEQANDKRILAKFPDAAPPAASASQSIIDSHAGLLKDLREERNRLVAARDQEKRYLGSSDTGMGPRWRELNAQVADYDSKISAQIAAEAAAQTAKQDRVDYDGAKARQEANAKVTANDGATLKLFYDHPFVIFLRVVGGATVSILGVIVALAARKRLEEMREAAAAKAEASERAKKGWDKRRNGPKDAEYSEAAPLDSRAIPDFGHVTPGSVAPADTQIRQETDANTHPDAGGDDFGARVNGHGKEEDDGTEESGQPKGQ